MTTASPAPDAVAADPDVRQVAAANTDLGFRLLKQLNEEAPDKNIFFSPFSVSGALTLALNGAGGTTQTHLAAALGLETLPLEQINRANGLLLPVLRNPDPQVRISVANALWAGTDLVFDTEFQKRCHQFYDARADTLDFSTPAAADTINGWVKDATSGKIDRLVSADDLRGSAAVLTNALYFHGLWSRKFDKSHTQSKPFALGPDSTKLVPMMTQQGSYAYLETPQFQAISFPYGQGRLSLYVFLPKPDSLSEFIAGLDANVWREWLGTMRLAGVTLFLPRFKAECLTRMKGPLCRLGMASAFTAGADFKPMGLHDGFIGDVIHKAMLEMDEEGTTAAAATAMSMPRGITRPNAVMRVDHPFFCAIRDNVTGTLLFAGVIRDPQ